MTRRFVCPSKPCFCKWNVSLPRGRKFSPLSPLCFASHQDKQHTPPSPCHTTCDSKPKTCVFADPKSLPNHAKTSTQQASFTVLAQYKLSWIWLKMEIILGGLSDCDLLKKGEPGMFPSLYIQCLKGKEKKEKGTNQNKEKEEREYRSEWKLRIALEDGSQSS